MSGTWPPSSTTSTRMIVPSYPYQQYNDDDNIAAFFTAYNQVSQNYLNWFNATPLGDYTNSNVSGPLLDWVAEGLYGIGRPSIPDGTIVAFGLFDTIEFNTLEYNAIQISGAINSYIVTDDIFRRVITWSFFKGDGQQFTIQWLKRRIVRFLIGTNGTAPNIDNTYQIGVAFGNNYAVTITITLTSSGSITLQNAQIFQAAVQSAIIPLPFQFSFSVAIVNNIGPTNFLNDGGWLNLTLATGWPTSPSGLVAGAVWDNGGIVTVVPGVTPNPFAAPLYFGLVTSGSLLMLGGGNLPLTAPAAGSGQLWNNGGVVGIA